MTSVTLVKRDLIEVMKSGYPMMVMHGCNMQGAMGAGFAKEVRAFAEPCYYDYANWLDFQEDANMRPTLGDVRVNQQHSVLFFHALTQDTYGREERKLNYGALAKACSFVNSYLKKNPEVARLFRSNIGSRIHMPKIGCGLAGGDWNIVKEILQVSFDSDISIVVYEK